MEVAPPCNGGDPSSQWSQPFPRPFPEPYPPAPRRRGASEGEEINEVESALLELTAETSENEAERFALYEIVAPIVSQLRFDAPTIASALRELIKWVSEQNLTTFESPAVVKKVLEERRISVKPSDIREVVRRVIGLRPSPRKIAGDPVLMAEWPKVMQHLEHMCGQVRAQQAFSTFVIDRIAPPNSAGLVVAHVSTHEEWARRNVDLGLTSQFRVALSAVFPTVTGVCLSIRRAAPCDSAHVNVL
jgi:hypothetical protein